MREDVQRTVSEIVNLISYYVMIYLTKNVIDLQTYSDEIE